MKADTVEFVYIRIIGPPELAAFAVLPG